MFVKLRLDRFLILLAVRSMADGCALNTSPGHALQTASTGMSTSHLVTRIVGFFIGAGLSFMGSVPHAPDTKEAPGLDWRICHRFLLRFQLLLDRAGYVCGVRSDGGFEALYHIPITIDEEFGEVPLDLACDPFSRFLCQVGI